MMSKANGREVVVADKKAQSLTAGKTFSLAPNDLKEAMDLAKMIAESDLAPKDYKGKAGNTLIAMQMGMELGIPPMQAIQNIAVINGRPSIYGDLGKAILLSKGFKIDERDVKEIQVKSEAWCRVVRPDGQVIERTYSVEDAKRAGLWNKQGPWTTNTYRQMAWRAFWFAARDGASDVLKGLAGAEEMQDIVETTATEAPAVMTPKPIEKIQADATQAPENANAILNPAQLTYLNRMLSQWGAESDEVTRFISDKFTKKTLAELTVAESRIVLKAWANEPPLTSGAEQK